MTGLLARAREVMGEEVTYLDEYATLIADVPSGGWRRAATLARDALSLVFFDWLTAVDQLDDGFDVLVRLWDPVGRDALVLRTGCSRDRPRLPSLSSVFAGASWHERAIWEMFGIEFDGHPGLRPLLLPDGFEGHPMRKEFVLASRVVKPWPGSPEPGESASDAATRPQRRRVVPPGVPPPGQWP